jgi:hypothetical protein
MKKGWGFWRRGFDNRVQRIVKIGFGLAGRALAIWPAGHTVAGSAIGKLGCDGLVAAPNAAVLRELGWIVERSVPWSVRES